MKPDVKTLQLALPVASTELRGLMLGFIGVLGFSLTLPMTRLAVAELSPVLIGLGRALVAAVLAGLLLVAKREPIPQRRHWGPLLIVAGGVIVGFPLFSALALSRVAASHGAIVTALLPLATAVAAVFRAHERPSLVFWLAALTGTGAVVSYLVWEHGTDWRLADGYLLAAVATCAIGYAEGGRLARELGGWRVIAWALVFSAPLLVIPVAFAARTGLHASWPAWAAFGYLSAISMFAAFCAWYAGLALGGVAGVSQVQLLQPFLSLSAATLLLNEKISSRMLVTLLVVIGSVALGRKAAIRRRPSA
jgi:drug/metabolite transporter (DMT)-like permease